MAMQIWNVVAVSWNLYVRDACQMDTRIACLNVHSMLHLDFFLVVVGLGLRTALDHVVSFHNPSIRPGVCSPDCLVKYTFEIALSEC
jgi:hypothetical protein